MTAGCQQLLPGPQLLEVGAPSAQLARALGPAEHGRGHTALTKRVPSSSRHPGAEHLRGLFPARLWDYAGAGAMELLPETRGGDLRGQRGLRLHYSREQRAGALASDFACQYSWGSSWGPVTANL